MYFVFTQVARAVAAKVVISLSKLGNILVDSMKVGSPPVTITLPRMAMDVRKTTGESLTKQKIQSNIGICKIDGVLDLDDDSCVSAKVE